MGGGTLHIECGEKTSSGTNASGLATWNITFEKPFDTVPDIFVRSKDPSGDYNTTYGQYVSAGATNITTTGFTLGGRQNYTGQTRSFTIEYLAIENSSNYLIS